MSDLLPFDRAPTSPPLRARGRSLWLRMQSAIRGEAAFPLLGALPLLVLTLLLGQIVFLGILPALREDRRLDAAELEVSSWEQRLEAASLSADRHERMLGDPIWRERVHRSLHTAGEAPLRFEDEPVETR